MWMDTQTDRYTYVSASMENLNKQKRGSSYKVIGKTDLILHKSDSNLRLDKYRKKKTHLNQVCNTSLFGDPNVMRFEFDDYPISVYESRSDDKDPI